jgi:hypothetical protein
MFRLCGHGDAKCSKGPTFSAMRSVSGDGSYPSASFTPQGRARQGADVKPPGDRHHPAEANHLEWKSQRRFAAGASHPPTAPGLRRAA